MKQFKHTDITDSIIGVFYKVYNALGYGFLEKVYSNAMSIELKELGLDVKQEFAIDLVYRGRLIGEYFADLVVAGKVIVELKATRTVTPDHEAQLLNYLKASRFEVGLLFILA